MKVSLKIEFDKIISSVCNIMQQEIQSAYFPTPKWSVLNSKKWLQSHGIDKIPGYTMENNFIKYEFHNKNLFNSFKKKRLPELFR